MRRLTLSLAAIWGVATIALLLELPARNHVLLYCSLGFVLYYFMMSLALQIRTSGLARATSMALSD
jgi:hypothetical protein